jgi:hypothetical protein
MPLGEIFLLRRRQLGRQQVEEDRQLLPFRVAVRNHRRKESVGAAEHLGLALEVDLLVLVKRLSIDGHAGIEDRVELVAVSAAEKHRHHLPHLLRRVDLRPVQRRLQVVQLVRVGLSASSVVR